MTLRAFLLRLHVAVEEGLGVDEAGADAGALLSGTPTFSMPVEVGTLTVDVCWTLVETTTLLVEIDGCVEDGAGAATLELVAGAGAGAEAGEPELGEFLPDSEPATAFVKPVEPPPQKVMRRLMLSA